MCEAVDLIDRTRQDSLADVAAVAGSQHTHGPLLPSEVFFFHVLGSVSTMFDSCVMVDFLLKDPLERSDLMALRFTGFYAVANNELHAAQ
ncbi:hypothetical protein Y032_0108g16 [Ancylostoma ceylanicum]|uniref:Uncharacterized protein n=1 Tax=Ancylostoma ceylanicum TaxID=53326 RepID=A0A016TF78_9BILA|nr:hypothetical protein Y032_0108g16 [Ancylostoma ceylanicum]